MGLRESHGEAARTVLDRVASVEMVGPILSQAETGFGRPLRTLDALHLASLLFLRSQSQDVTLASYDRRLAAAAEAAGVKLYEL